MGLFPNLFGDKFEVTVTREEFEAHEAAKRAALEKARREFEEQQLALKREKLQEEKTKIIERGPGFWRKLGWKVEDTLGFFIERVWPIVLSPFKFLYDKLEIVALTSFVCSAIWTIIHCYNYGLGTTFFLSIPMLGLPGFVLLMSAAIAHENRKPSWIQKFATLFFSMIQLALFIILTNYYVVSPSDGYVAVTSGNNGQSVEVVKTDSLPFFVKWEPEKYTATRFYNAVKASSVNVPFRLQQFNVNAGVRFNIYLNESLVPKLFNGELDSDKEVEKIEQALTAILQKSLESMNKDVETIVVARHVPQYIQGGFPQEIFQGQLIKWLNANLGQLDQNGLWVPDSFSVYVTRPQ